MRLFQEFVLPRNYSCSLTRYRMLKNNLGKLNEVFIITTTVISMMCLKFTNRLAGYVITYVSSAGFREVLHRTYRIKQYESPFWSC